jgi:hypothetical protein
MLLSMPADDEDPEAYPERLARRARSFGMGRTPVQNSASR